MSPQQMTDLYQLRERIRQLDNDLGRVQGLEEDDEATLDRVSNHLNHAMDELKSLLDRKKK